MLSDCPDILCWKLTPNGKYTSKSAYKACLQVLQESGAPSPAPVCNQVKIILKQVCKAKEMIPRVKTFIWRILRRAIPTGDQASRYSKHIEKCCFRCGLSEIEFQLFSLCPFAKAAWFLNPWFFRSEVFTQMVIHLLMFCTLSFLWIIHNQIWTLLPLFSGVFEKQGMISFLEERKSSPSWLLFMPRLCFLT
jgi:hypothetical protein